MNPRTILVVDHSKMMQKMYELMLRRYPIVYAEDGRQALERLRQHAEVDLVLLDLSITVPGMTMVELLQQLRGLRPDAPTIVAVSTEGHDADVVSALDNGAAAYIKKPFQAEELNEAIDRLPTSSDDE